MKEELQVFLDASAPEKQVVRQPKRSAGRAEVVVAEVVVFLILSFIVPRRRTATDHIKPPSSRERRLKYSRVLWSYSRHRIHDLCLNDVCGYIHARRCGRVCTWVATTGARLGIKAGWIFKVDWVVHCVTIEIDSSNKFNRVLVQKSANTRIVVSGAIGIEASFGIRFADGGHLAGFSYVVHEVQSKPAHATPAYAAPKTSRAPTSTPLASFLNVCAWLAQLSSSFIILRMQASIFPSTCN